MPGNGRLRYGKPLFARSDHIPAETTESPHNYYPQDQPSDHNCQRREYSPTPAEPPGPNGQPRRGRRTLAVLKTRTGTLLTCADVGAARIWACIRHEQTLGAVAPC